MINKLIVLFFLVFLSFPLYAEDGQTTFNTTILLSIIGGVLAFICWLMKRAIDGMDEKIDKAIQKSDKNTDKIEDVEDKLNTMKLDILDGMKNIEIKLAEFRTDYNAK